MFLSKANERGVVTNRFFLPYSSSYEYPLKFFLIFFIPQHMLWASCTSSLVLTGISMLQSIGITFSHLVSICIIPYPLSEECLLEWGYNHRQKQLECLPRDDKKGVHFKFTLHQYHMPSFLEAPSPISMLNPSWITIICHISWGCQHWDGEETSNRANLLYLLAGVDDLLKCYLRMLDPPVVISSFTVL